MGRDILMEMIKVIHAWLYAHPTISRLLSAVLIALCGYAIAVVLSRITKRLFKKLGRHKNANQNRADTYASILSSVVKYVFLFLTLMQILSLFGLASTVNSLLATAGIGGLAIGFGAQNLIRDLVTGLFMLWENQYAVGEYVKIGTFIGKVEEFKVRVTVLRSPIGELHTIPNGSVANVTNYSRGEMTASSQVTVDINENPQRAIKAMQEALLHDFPQDAPVVLGITETLPAGYVVRFACHSACDSMEEKERAMLLCVLRALAHEKIAIAGGVVPVLED